MSATLTSVAERFNPIFRTTEAIHLVGTFAIYDSQSQASQGIPNQWQGFLSSHPALAGNSQLYGASPCTHDGKIHYLTGAVHESSNSLISGDPLTLEPGEYAVVRVAETALLRDAWGWLLGTWLAASGRRERPTPEFERYTSISETGFPVGPVEIWIPLEPLATS